MNVLYIYLPQLKIHPMNDYSTKLSIDHYKELESKVQKRLGKIEGIEEMLRFCKAVKFNNNLNNN